MGIRGESFEEFFHIFVDHGVIGELSAEVCELAGGGEFAVEEEPGGFDEVGVFGELFDGVTAVAEDAFVAVDEGDGTFAGAGAVEAGVHGDGAGLAEQFGDIDGCFVFGAADDGEIPGFSIEGQ